MQGELEDSVRGNSEMGETVVTIDIDWAPDFAIDFVSAYLIERRVHATWFVTHNSPAVERLRSNSDLFELGIHPNFLPGSSHGDTAISVIEHCMNLVPDATSMRTHALFQSTPLLNQFLTSTPVSADVSLFLPHAPQLQPVEHHFGDRVMLRIPYYWEDDLEMMHPDQCWDAESMLGIGHGFKVFDFHPIHVYLNSVEMKPYEALKRAFPELERTSPVDADSYLNDGVGTRTMFAELVDHLAVSGDSVCVREIDAIWRANR